MAKKPTIDLEGLGFGEFEQTPPPRKSTRAKIATRNKHTKVRLKRPKKSAKVKIKERKVKPKFTTVVTKVISPRGRQIIPLTDIRGAPAPGQPISPQNIVLESTAIAAFKYDPESKILEITFVSGAVYWYFGVDPVTVEKLASPFTTSKGRYFVNHIRNNFGTPRRIR